MNTPSELLRALPDLLIDAVCVVDEAGQFLYLSAAAERIFGYHPSELVGTPMLDLVHPDDRARTLEAAGEIMAGLPKFMFENRYVRKDGQVVDIMWSARWAAAERVRIAVARDITERKRGERQQAALYAISEAAHAALDLDSLYRAVHRILAGLLDATNFCIVQAEARPGSLEVVYHQDACTGPAHDALALDVARAAIGSAAAVLRTSDTSAPCHPTCVLAAPLRTAQADIGALILRTYPGQRVYTDTDLALLQFVSTQVAAAIERKRLQARLHYMAQYDELTRLPKRSLLYDRIETALARARRGQTGGALLYLDLDRFKVINDTLGHGAGDRVLEEAAQRLLGCVRAADTVARVGGDEFVVLLEHVTGAEQPRRLAAKITRALERPLEVEGRTVQVGASVGVALFPEHGDTARALIRHADHQMYAAKLARRAPLE
jgi:diguanylate cyclase (GGDEF)-like protein/PAS domain S-box-containing protein